MNAATAALAAALSSFAHDVNELPSLTDSQIASLGLPLQKDPVHTGGVPGVQADLVLRHGDMPGAVTGSLKAVGDNNIVYEAEWTLDPTAGPWTAGEPFTNTRKFTLSGLPRGKDVFVRVRARNTNGAGPWSDVATIMVT